MAASGGYKNLKDMGDNTYRITKITGAVTITVTTIKSETASGYILGDADGDGKVTVIDATVIQRYLAGLSVPDTFNYQAACVSGEKLSILDATYIQRYLAEFDVPYAIGETVNS